MSKANQTQEKQGQVNNNGKANKQEQAKLKQQQQQQKKKNVKKVKKTMANPYEYKFKILSSEQQKKITNLYVLFWWGIYWNLFERIKNNINELEILFDVNNIVERLSNQCNDIEILLFPDAHHKQMMNIQVDHIKIQCGYSSIPFINLELNLEEFSDIFKECTQSSQLHKNNFIKTIAILKNSKLREMIELENNFGPAIESSDLYFKVPTINFGFLDTIVEDVLPIHPKKNKT